MAKRPGQKITMISIDELLCVPDTEGTIDIDVEAIYPFENCQCRFYFVCFRRSKNVVF